MARRRRYVAQARQNNEVIKATVNEFIIRFHASRGWRDHEAAAEYVNGPVWIRTNSPRLAVVAIPTLIVAGARAHENWCGTMSVKGLGEYAFVTAVNVENCQAAALTRTEP
jgi:hypothetical protein